MKTLIVEGKSRKLFKKSYICWIRCCLFIIHSLTAASIRNAHPQMSVTDVKGVMCLIPGTYCTYWIGLVIYSELSLKTIISYCRTLRDASFKTRSSLTRSKQTVCPSENSLSGRITIALAWHELKRVSQLVNARSWRVARAWVSE